MSSTYSMDTIARLTDFFGGASQHTSTTLSGLTPLLEAFRELIPADTTTVSFGERVPGAQFVHVLQLESEKANDAQMHAIWQKFFCHVLIAKLPENALPEAEERLVEIYDDYLRKDIQLPLTSALPPRLLVARQGPHHPRPEIELED